MNADSVPIMCDSMTGGDRQYMEESIKIKTKKTRAKKMKEDVSTEVKVETFADTIRKMVDDETALEKLRNEIKEQTSSEGKDVLSHLGEYIEEPYHLIESYFQGQHLERLVRHQIESYNHFINYQVQRTIQMFNPVTIRSENDYIEEK